MAVSAAESSRCFFPRWPGVEVPVSHVTNGVHMPTWESAEADELWAGGAAGPNAGREILECSTPICASLRTAVWQLRNETQQRLIEYMRNRLARPAGSEGSPERKSMRHRRSSTKSLTLGFARRFATYKRPNLLYSDPERLIRTLTNDDRKVCATHPRRQGASAGRHRTSHDQALERIHPPARRRDPSRCSRTTTWC